MYGDQKPDFGQVSGLGDQCAVLIGTKSKVSYNIVIKMECYVIGSGFCRVVRNYRNSIKEGVVNYNSLKLHS